MKKIILIPGILLLSFTFCLSQTNIQEDGFTILKVGISASMTGKGEAVSASQGDATILWYNPSASLNCQSSNFCFSHNSYIFKNNIENASLIIKKGNHSYGLGVIFLNYGREDKRDTSAELIGEWHAIDLVVAGNYAKRISPYLSFGTNLKMVYEKIDTESSYGFATDFGILYDSFIKGLNLAFVTQNIGFSTKMKKERITFPLTYKVGFNYDISFTNQSELSFSTDFIKYIDDDTKINMGMEYAYSEVIYTRSGYKLNYDEQDFSAGLGLKINNYRFDYSFTPYKSDIGNAHRFSISYDF